MVPGDALRRPTLTWIRCPVRHPTVCILGRRARPSLFPFLAARGGGAARGAEGLMRPPWRALRSARPGTLTRRSAPSKVGRRRLPPLHRSQAGDLRRLVASGRTALGASTTPCDTASARRCSPPPGRFIGIKMSQHIFLSKQISRDFLNRSMIAFTEPGIGCSTTRSAR